MSPSQASQNTVQIGGRKSKLAVRQSEIVRDIIQSNFPHIDCPILALSTLGDKIQTKPLYSFGGKALWTKELELLLMSSVEEYPQLDMIVHSLKDMPTNLPDTFELGCVLNREDPRDALVMAKGSPFTLLRDLPSGSVVGTSSVRRLAQLMKNYPHLRFDSVRGNVQTRLDKLDDEASPFSCLVLAAAGLTRLGLGHRITMCLDAPDMYYAVGQGALGIEIRKGDTRIKGLLSKLEHMATSFCCLAERSLMRYLEGGCLVPIGVHTHYDEDTKVLRFKGIVVLPDGLRSVEDVVSGQVTLAQDAEDLGILLGDLLIAQGGKAILEEIDFQRINEPPATAVGTPSISSVEVL